MRKGDCLYVGHMFSDGITVVDVADPRAPKPVDFITGGPNTRSHHIQVAGDLLLAVNGANILALQTYDQQKSYYENSLADNFSSRRTFAAGLRIYDVSRPAAPREIAFLDIPGIGLNRLWYVAAATPTSPRISTASPTISSRSSTCRSRRGPRSSAASGCRA